MTQTDFGRNGLMACTLLGALLTAVASADPRTTPIELEMDQFTASYDLNDGGLNPENKDQDGWPNDHDGRWSWMPWDKWGGLTGKAIMIWTGERVDPPLHLTYALPNGQYDVYLGVNHHTFVAMVEVRLGLEGRAGPFRWIRTPHASSDTISNVKAGTATVTDGKLYLWLRNGRGYWTAIDYVRIGPVGFNPDWMGVEDQSLLEPKFSPEAAQLRRRFEESTDISKLVMDGSDGDAVLCMDVTGIRTRPHVKRSTAHLGGLDAALPGDDRYIQLASHVYINSNGRRHLLMGVERTAGSGPLLLECGYLRKSDGSLNAQVLWDGKLIGELDCRHEVPHVTVSGFVIPAPSAGTGQHILEIREGELIEDTQDFAWIDAVAVTGEGQLRLYPPLGTPGPQERSKLRFYDARYKPDRDPTVPLGGTVVRNTQRDFAATGSLHFYLANDGPAPAENFRCYLDGRDLEQLRHDFGTPYPDEPRLIWWRVRPPRVEPGALAEVTIRFTRPPKMPASFTIRADNSEPLSFEVDARQPPFRVEYVAFPPAIDRMYIYLEFDAPVDQWELGSVSLDTVDVTGRCKVYPAGRHHQLILLSLEAPLSDASHHVLRVTDKQGHAQTVQVMAWSSIYCVGAFNVFGHLMNDQPGSNVNSIHTLHALRGGISGVSTLREVAHRGVRQVIMALGELSDDAKRYSSSILGYFLVDEPDAIDDPLREGNPYWIGSSLQGYVDYGTLLQELWPLPTTMIVNMTTRPDNLFVYGQAVDILQHDPYYPPNVVRPQIRSAAQAASPHPAMAVLWAFSEWLEAPPRPSPAVIRMNTYSAVGAGAKGSSFAFCVFKNQGYGQVPELQQAVHKINAELLQAAPLLNLSHPIVTGIQVPDGVWARAVLCGDRGAVLSMVNDKVTRQAERQVIDLPGGGQTQIPKGAIIGYEDLGPFDAVVELPKWFQAGSASLITPEGPSPVKFTQSGSTLTCHEVNIGAGAMVLIKTGKL